MTQKPLHSEVTLEEQLKAMGLEAPRVSPAMIDSLIEGTEIHHLSDSHIVCKLTMFGGRFHVLGESSTISKENFNAELGEKKAYEQARAKVWPVAGAILAHELHNFRYPLSEEQLQLDVGVQRVITEAKEINARTEGLAVVLGDESIRAQLDAGELELLDQQLSLYRELSIVLENRLRRIGL